MSKEKKKYRVDLSLETEETVYVSATSETEAGDLAIEEAVTSDLAFHTTWSVDFVEELQPKEYRIKAKGIDYAGNPLEAEFTASIYPGEDTTEKLEELAKKFMSCKEVSKVDII